MKEVFRLYASCITVKGYNRSVICDIQRGNIFYIPEGLYEILTTKNDKSTEEIKGFYDNEIDDVVDHYFNYLLEHELGFFCNNPESFPEIEKLWQSPEIVSNAILVIEQDSTFPFTDIFQQLSQLGCKYLEVRSYKGVKIDKIQSVLDASSNTTLRNIDFIIKYHQSFEHLDFNDFFIRNRRVGSLTLFESRLKQKPDLLEKHRLKLVRESIGANIHCGNVSPNYFAVNRELFMESHFHNNCLNKKISIDANGDIKNCPSMNKSYGNINYQNLSDIISNPDLTKFWNITKDQVEGCSICEFRYICTDCRAYVENPDNIYSKPLKCGYNPKTNEWSSWSKNPLKYTAIKFYGMDSLKK